MSADTLWAMPPSLSRWYEIPQTRIDGFADVTEDWLYIHLDTDRMAGQGGTMAHGFLTLSMLSAMSYDVQPEVPGLVQSLNYGFDRLRFVSPVRAGQRIRGRFATNEEWEELKRQQAEKEKLGKKDTGPKVTAPKTLPVSKGKAKK